MANSRLRLTRGQILAFRRAVGALDERLPLTAHALRRAGWAGLQDSMPRAALLSIHARVAGAEPSTWEHPSLVQLWGPRSSAYVVPERDRAPFSLGRLPDAGPARAFAEDLAARLHAFLDGRRMSANDAARGLGLHHPNALRYAAPTGRVLMRWDGARRPDIWTVPPPDVDPLEARLELARRYLHVFGPGTPESFAEWAGIKPPRGKAAFDALGDELMPVRTPVGDGWILAADEASFTAPMAKPTGARLLPSGDAYYLLQGSDRELLVPEAGQRAALWTSRVWPGAVLVDGEIVGTWRRADTLLSIRPWRGLSPSERHGVESEATSLPLPGDKGAIRVRWDTQLRHA
jgi:Winged helix DNA-binding domain